MSETERQSKIKFWILAARPKTLPAAFVPVIVGSSLAFAEGKLELLSSLVALCCALLIQIGTNFTNDLYDYLKGADTEKRIGPKRALSAGWVTPSQMKFAIILTFLLCFALGLYLVSKAGIIILIIGLLSITAGLAYTAGPFPLAYNGLGDLFVLLFFGFVGTMGTYYVHTNSLTVVAALASVPVGALITNILVVNNYRDIEQDRMAGKFTLVVLMGKTFARYEYLFLIIASFLVPLIIIINYGGSFWLFLPYLSLPFAYKLVVMMFNLEGEKLNKTLELSAKFSALFGFLFALGFIL